MLSFQKLDVYRCSIEFLVFSRRLRLSAARGNADLVDQIRRAAQSVPQNIAEGVGKVSRADKVRYFGIARGSAMESADHEGVHGHVHVNEHVLEHEHVRATTSGTAAT